MRSSTLRLPLRIHWLRPPTAEVLDYGYPQNSAPDVLKMYINFGSLKAPSSTEADVKITSTITGARDWRRDGILHKNNEVRARCGRRVARPSGLAGCVGLATGPQ